MKARTTLVLALLSLLACLCRAQTSFDLEAWKAQYGTPLTPVQFYSTRPGAWGSYFEPFNPLCASSTRFHLGPLGIMVRPYDQALTTPAFAALYPPYLVDSTGLIQNAFGVLDTPAGGPADGKVYPGDVILEMEDQRIKTGADVNFPFPVVAKNARGLEIHAGQLVDAAEGRGAIKFKVIRAALTAYTSPTLTAPTTTSEIVVNVSGKSHVRLTTVSGNNCLTNWINPRLEGGAGGTLYLNAQTIVQTCGYASPQMGKDATGATVYDGATPITNCIGTRANSMIEYAVPSGYTTLKFKVQTTGTGSATASIKTRTSSITATPYNPRQFDANGAPLLPPELAAYTETIEFPIPQIGSFGSFYDPTSAKVANYSATLAHRLAQEQSADGSFPPAGGDYASADFRTALVGLGLMATGDPAFNTHIQKAAYFCATIPSSDWAYPRGIRVMFLAEYYLRTRDTAILPGLQDAVKGAENVMMGDFLCGHKFHPGYSGYGYIGATGTVSAGLAVASKTPSVVDLTKLDTMLERVQELAGYNTRIPYGRGIGRAPFQDNPTLGNGSSAWAAGVLAMKIRGGPKYITELFRAGFTNPAGFGAADGGHASEALPFVMGSLATAIWGDEFHNANMNTFLWRLTLKRDYSGYINLNTNRFEYHGGDGGCHGGPGWDTGGYLILLNKHKQNLAITGKPELQASAFPDVPKTYDVDRRFYWRVLNDWNMVDAALGSKMPAAIQPKLEELRSMPLGLDLGDRVLAFLQREALSAATLVNGVAGLTSPERQFYCEMLLGNGHDIYVASIDNPVPTTGLSNYKFSLNGYTAKTTWTGWGHHTVSPDPTTSTQMTGSVTLTDPSGIYLPTPVVLNFSPSNLNPTTTFQAPVDQQVIMNATFNYTVGGTLSLNYTRDFVINPTVPTPGGAHLTNVRKVWIPGVNPRPFISWTLPVQLPSGQKLACVNRGFFAYDNGSLVTMDSAYYTRMHGNPAGYWCTSSDGYGEVAVLGVNLLPGPVLTTATPSGVTSNSAVCGGTITSDNGWPVTRRGVCWSASPNPTIFANNTSDGVSIGTFASTLTNLQPGITYYVRAYATNAFGTSYGQELTLTTSGISGTWTTVGGGSWKSTTNWLNGIDASGTDAIANFGTVTPNVDATVTLDDARLIGGIIFGNGSFTKKWILNPGSGGPLTLDIGTSGDPSIAVNGGTAIINTVLAGNDGLIKTGPGSLILNATNNYAGLTAVSAGTLQIDGSLSPGTPVTVASGATLLGTGSIAGPTSVSGTISPGVSGIGTLTLTNALTLSGTATMQISKSAGTCDKIAGLKSVTYGGTLSVTNLAGTLAAGDKFVLFPATSYKGAFAAISLPTLTGGLEWDTSSLLVDGSIQVGFDAAITSQPANQSIGQGVTATFAVTATGSPAPSYQWQTSTDGGATWANISGATSSSYVTSPAITGDSGKRFRCVVSNAFATVTSNSATLTVTANSVPEFTLHPSDVILSGAGQLATFTAAASGTPTPGYQWQVSADFGASWANVPGATNASYTFTAAAGDDNKAYRCVATNNQGTATSNYALILISSVPVWTNRAGGSWPVNSNWSNNTVADGSGTTADFSRLNLSSPLSVTLDGSRTIGSLKFGDVTNAFGWTLGAGTGGTLTLATSSGTPTITVNNQQAQLSCVLAGSNGLAKAGAGNLTLTAANTFTGGTTLSNGQLTLNNANALAGGALTITGGSLGNSSGATVTVPGNKAWNGDFAINGPDNLVLSGPITLSANRTISVNAPATANGAISGAYSLTKTGSGTLTMNVGSTYSGGTFVNGGTLYVAAGGWFATRCIGSGLLTVNSGGTARFGPPHSFGITPGGQNAVVNGGTLIFDTENAVNALTLTGGTVSGGGEIRIGAITVPVNASANSSNIAIRLAFNSGSPTFNVSDGAAAADLIVSGSMTNVHGFTKTGTGLMRVKGTASYTGATNINAGTLQLDGGALGSGAVTIATGATLAGSGTVAGATTINGNLTGGVDSNTGTLTFSNNLTLSSNTVTALKLSKTGAITFSDRISVGGTFACAGTLNVTAGGDPFVGGDTFQLISAPTLTGTFASVNLPVLSGLVWDTSKLYIDGTISLVKATQAITFAPLSSATCGDTFLLNASSSSGLAVTFSSSNPAIALIQHRNQVIAVGAGTTTITASQAGNFYYQAAPDVSRTLTVNGVLPVVQTASVTWVGNNTAASGGIKIWDGGSLITERGVCWNTSPNPTIADSRTLDGTGSADYTSTLTGLTGSTTYYVRAYVKNAAGYTYGENQTYITPGSGLGVWILDGNGNWTTTSNWADGFVPNGANNTANIAAIDITGNRTITLNAAVSLGGLSFADANPTNHWTVTPSAGGTLTLATSSGTPAVSVTNQSATIGAVVGGTQGFVKSGSGTLSLTGVNTISGGITLSRGTLAANHSSSMGSTSKTLTLGDTNTGLNPVEFKLDVGLTSAVNLASIATSNYGTSQTVTLNSGSSLGSNAPALTATLNLNGSIPLLLKATNTNHYSAQDMNIRIQGTGIPGGMTALILDGSAWPLRASQLSSTSAASNFTGDVLIKGTVTTQNRTYNGQTAGNQNLNFLNNDITINPGASWSIVWGGETTGALSGSGNIVLNNQNALNNIGLTVGNNNRDGTYSGAISGTFGVAKVGSGVQTFAGVNSYSGATTVSGGTLRVNGSIANGAVTVASGGTLGGVGSIGGATTVQSGGTLAPGSDGVGTLTLNNTLSLSGTTAMEISKSGTTRTADKVSGVSTVTYGGALEVTNLGPDPLTLGDTFTLFSATNRAGSFSSIALPELNPGLAWSTTQLSVNGTISIRGLPVATEDIATVQEDSSVNIPVLTNDSDLDGDPLSIQSVTNGVHGQVSIAGGSVTYTPAANWHGPDSFLYTITDSQDGTATAIVTLTVTPVNDGPIFTANPLTGSSATEDAAYTSTLTTVASDADPGDTLIFAKLSGPAWLSVSNNGALTGTPANSDVGANTFSVRVTDAAGAFTEAALNVTVANTNDAPTWASGTITKAAATEDIAYSGSLAADASDVDSGDTLTFSKVSGPAWLDVAANGSLSGTPTFSNVGLNAFTVRVTDVAGSTADAILQITVNATGVWTNAAGGAWPTGANWSGGTIASGSGKTANFSTLNLTTNPTVTLDGARTIGALIFGDTTPSHNWTLNTGSGGTLTLTTSTSTPAIHVTNQSTTIGAVVAGNQGFVKSGGGTLTLSGANTISGAFTLSNGILAANHQSAMGATTNTLTLGDANTGSNAVEFKVDSAIASAVTLASITTSNDGSSQTVTLNSGTALAANQPALVSTLHLNGNVPLTLKATNTSHSTAQDINCRMQGSCIPAGTTALILDGTTKALRLSQLSTTSTASNFTGDVLIKGSVSTQGRTYNGQTANNQNLTFLNNDITINSGATWSVVWGGETAGAINGSGNISLSNQNALNNIGLTVGYNNRSGSYSGVISGGFGVAKAGAGTQTFTGANTYSGATTISGGTLRVNGSLANGAVTVASGGTLGGTGTIGGATTVQSGGTLAPGSGNIGTLTINNTLTLSGTTTMEISKSGASLTTDKVSGVSTVTFGGALVVTDLGPDALVAGNTFTLFSATTRSGSFSSITLPTIASGLTWDTTQLADNGTITVVGSPAAGWASKDVGSVGVAGSSSVSGGTYTIAGAGTDIGGTADNFQYAWQTLSGDGEIRARVTSQNNTASTAKAGVMIRESSAANAKQALMAITPGSGFQFRHRSTAGGSTTSVAGGSLNTAPNNWVRLTRSGTLIAAYASGDGSTWTQVGTATISMAANVNVGLAVTSANNSTTSTATFDNVTITLFPAPWVTADIGSPTAQGSAEHYNSAYTLKGAGSIGGTSDVFRFLYQTLSADGSVTARISVPANTSGARLGVMIRDSLTANAPNVFMGIDGTGAFLRQQRSTSGGSTSSTSGGSGTAPNIWVSITRSGNSFTAYQSSDGVNWTQVGSSVTITMASTIYIGLADGSGTSGSLNTTVFDNVTVVP